MWYRKQEIVKMDKQMERAGDDNKNNIGVLYGIGVAYDFKGYQYNKSM